MNHYIYKITNKLNNKSYIGKTINPVNRFACHCSSRSKSYISRAIQKYGKDNFKFEVLEVIQFLYEPSREDIKKYVDSREIFWISFYQTLLNGYNLTEGGEGAYGKNSSKLQNNLSKNGTHPWQSEKYRKETSERMIKRHKESSINNNHNFQSSEHRLLISNKNKISNSIEYICPHCNRKIKGIGNFKRYHNDNCKLKFNHI